MDKKPRCYLSGAITGVKHADKLFARAEEKEEEAAEKNVQEKFEEMKREHPLVTDKRCFTLSWFPETIPFVMSEEEE